jgi:carboxyl-terminal processing protease
MKRLIRALCIVAAVSGVFGAGYFSGISQRPASAQTPRDELFIPFFEAWDLVQDRFVYVDRLGQEKLMEAALNGFVNALEDEHTGYMNPEAYQDVLQEFSDEYEGIGATVRKDPDSGGIVIVSTSPDSPARAELNPGDVIIQVEGTDVTGLNLSEAVGLIRGPSGSRVKLGILRDGKGSLVEVDVLRAKIKRDIVTSRIYPGNIGYIALTGFIDESEGLLAKALRDMDANNLNGLVLDMRNNPGGGLETALNIASMFITDGNLIHQRGRPGTREIIFTARGGTIAADVPMVILLNEASASASELVAGALQDNGRAVVVGTRSFGKGSIQTWANLSNGGGFRVTVAEFTKPSGAPINHIGIIPDIYVGWSQEAQVARPLADPQLQEALWLLRGLF